MALLGAVDPLPARPERVARAGKSGSGNTTRAARIAAILDAAHIEIDALFQGPDWEPCPTFVEDVRRFAAKQTWVT